MIVKIFHGRFVFQTTTDNDIHSVKTNFKR